MERFIAVVALATVLALPSSASFAKSNTMQRESAVAHLEGTTQLVKMVQAVRDKVCSRLDEKYPVADCMTDFADVIGKIYHREALVLSAEIESFRGNDREVDRAAAALARDTDYWNAFVVTVLKYEALLPKSEREFGPTLSDSAPIKIPPLFRKKR